LKIRVNQGFTLLEVLVALAILGVIVAGIYSTFYSQQRSYIAQEQVAAMQKNLRAAMYLVEREIRMAGCDPKKKANAGIVDLGYDPVEDRYSSIEFTLDITNDSGGEEPDGDTDDTNENVYYALVDQDGDGDTDLVRDTGGGRHIVAENIDVLDFVYLNQQAAPTDNISEIRSVQITMVARTGKRDPGYKDTTVYKNQQPKTIYTANDNFRRRVLTTDIKFRNLGL